MDFDGIELLLTERNIFPTMFSVENDQFWPFCECSTFGDIEWDLSYSKCLSYAHCMHCSYIVLLINKLYIGLKSFKQNESETRNYHLVWNSYTETLVNIFIMYNISKLYIYIFFEHTFCSSVLFTNPWLHTNPAPNQVSKVVSTHRTGTHPYGNLYQQA